MIKTKKADINKLYLGLIILGLLALAFVLFINTRVGSGLKSMLFSNIESLSGFG